MAYCHCLDHNHGHNCLTTTNTQLLCIIMGLTLLSARHLDMYFFSAFVFPSYSQSVAGQLQLSPLSKYPPVATGGCVDLALFSNY
jgi:hypothetical protein